MYRLYKSFLNCTRITQLLYKLPIFGIKGRLLQWVSDYFNLRKMHLCVKENTSDIHNVTI